MKQPVEAKANVIKSEIVAIQEMWRTVWGKVWPELDFTQPDGDSNDFVNTNCPFHGDLKASSGVNINTGYFNCFSDMCDASDGYNFRKFISKYFKIDGDRATDKMLDNLASLDTKLNTLEVVEEKHNALLNNEKAMFNIMSLGISDQVIIDLKLGYGTYGETFSFPILMDDTLLGYKFYNKNPKEGRAKSWASKGLFNGLVAPFNEWKESRQNITVICAGEKDMLVARSNGFNAIMIIGGEGQLPTIGMEYFKSKEIWIAYDNDIAGVNAGKKLAHYLFAKKKIAKIKNLTSFHRGMLEKEDVTDYFTKYYRTSGEFQELGDKTPYWTAKDSNTFMIHDASMVPLTQAANNTLYGKSLNSFVQVKATAYEPKSIPARFIFDVETGSDKYEVDYEISSHNMWLLLGLIQTNTQVTQFIKNVICRLAINKSTSIPDKWKSDVKYKRYRVDYAKNLTIFTAYVGVYKENEIISKKDSNLEGMNDDIASFLVYTLNKPLQTSQIYRIGYKPIRNEYDNNTIVLMCDEFEDSENSIHSFEIGEKTTTLLRKFNTVTTVAAKINELFNVMKNKRIKHLNFDLWLANELTFNTPLDFMYRGKQTRGTIYTTIIGDTRVGKSELSQELVSLYSQGKFINGKLTTIDALIGGSVTRGKEQMIQAGVLPKANKSLVVLEEIHGLGNDYFKKITEVKSSGKVIINRVSGELKLDCKVRLIEIANPRSRDGESKNVADFANGVEIIKGLIESHEDIARNEIYIIVQRSPLIDSRVEEFSEEDKESYRERIKWVWSRDINDIIFEDESFIWEQAQELNKIFDCPGLVLLGAEGHIKLARLSVALAGILASTNSLEHKTIYVTNEHVSYCKEWLQRLYSNDLMRIDEFVKESKEYDIVYTNDITELKRLLSLYEPQIRQLENSTELHQDILSATIIGDSSNKSEFFNSIITYKFVRMGAGMKAKSLSPTIKFRAALKIIRSEVKTEGKNGMGKIL